MSANLIDRQKVLADAMDATFLAALGDLVYIVGSTHTSGLVPKAFVVVERFAQQCMSGVQRLYKLQGMDGYVSELAITKTMPSYQWSSKEHSLEQCQAARDIEQVRADISDARRSKWFVTKPDQREDVAEEDDPEKD